MFTLKRFGNIALMISLSLCPFLAKAGPGGTGGGDVVYCTGSGKLSKGYWSLDYVAQLGTSSSDELAFQKSAEALNGIESKLQQTLPGLAKDFGEFKNYYLKKSPLAKRNWRGGELPLVDIPDQELTRALPKDCQSIKQAVIRTTIGTNTVNYSDLPQKVIYDYDSGVFVDLDQRPLQASFTFIHEWLRDYFVDAFVIREVNWFFHSKEFQTSDGVALRNFLKQMGIKQDFNTKQEINNAIQYAKQVTQQGDEAIKLKVCTSSDPQEFLVTLGYIAISINNAMESQIIQSNVENQGKNILIAYRDYIQKGVATYAMGGGPYSKEGLDAGQTFLGCETVQDSK